MNKQQLTAVTIENTKKINTYLDLKKLYNKLENSLTSAQATMVYVWIFIIIIIIIIIIMKFFLDENNK